MVVVCDAEDRENEGDLVMAAHLATPEAIDFMTDEGRGLICLALTPQRCLELGLELMSAKNESAFQGAFDVSIAARSGGDRARTIQVAIDASTRPTDLVQPGHVVPLRARPGGVLERAGQTEAAVDLARLAGLNPAGVVCEVKNDDGTMARVPDLEALSARHELRMITVADLIAYRRRHDKLVERVVEARPPTEFGEFDNLELGLPPDLRDYGIGAQILVDLGLTTIRLLTNNPKKIVGLEGYGLRVTDQLPIQLPATEHNRDYLRAKRDRLGHLLHHQGLALDEEMIHEERSRDRARDRAESRDEAPERPGG